MEHNAATSECELNSGEAAEADKPLTDKADKSGASR
jgi:hypothetical protein